MTRYRPQFCRDAIRRCLEDGNPHTLDFWAMPYQPRQIWATLAAMLKDGEITKQGKGEAALYQLSPAYKLPADWPQEGTTAKAILDTIGTDWQRVSFPSITRQAVHQHLRLLLGEGKIERKAENGCYLYRKI